jgi:hypothetical protein
VVQTQVVPGRRFGEVHPARTNERSRPRRYIYKSCEHGKIGLAMFQELEQGPIKGTVTSKGYGQREGPGA